jgi:hypothetical protein
MAFLLVALVAVVLTAGAASPDERSAAAAWQQLAPTGTVRAAILEGPTPNLFRATLDPATNHPRGVAVAVPKNRPAALAYVTEFIEAAKASGVVRRALDDAGFEDIPVAPAASSR